MSMSAWKRVGVSLTAAAVVAGLAGCQGDDKNGDEKAGGQPKARTVTQVITAAYQKTAAAKSAKVRMTMSMPTATKGGGDMNMSGVLGWDPTVMDMTMSGGAFASDPDAPEKLRMVWRDNVMYMDLGATASKDMGGKRWMKLDFAEIAEKSGNEQLMTQMTAGMENMNQDPAQQLAMLLDSPNLKHVGSEKVEGVQAEHYKGTLTVEEMLASNKSLDVLDEKQRKDLLANMKKSGIKAYDTEVWVNEDDYPVKMDIGIDSPEGTIKISASYSDYGAKADVRAPSAAETFDFLEMFKELERQGAGSGL
ncbi:hypothetical protein [Streptomyces sp. KR80]|uniref:hypothetical protein n=1 Tax=Streptomyces sp. KR80 TaxID=3457426 RepID=UPI003FD58954